MAEHDRDDVHSSPKPSRFRERPGGKISYLGREVCRVCVENLTTAEAKVATAAILEALAAAFSRKDTP